MKKVIPSGRQVKDGKKVLERYRSLVAPSDKGATYRKMMDAQRTKAFWYGVRIGLKQPYWIAGTKGIEGADAIRDVWDAMIHETYLLERRAWIGFRRK